MILSIIVPAKDEAKGIKKFHSILSKTLSNLVYNYEIIIIDDGSADNTWSEILDLVRLDSSVKGLRLSRNFGKEAAVFAGLRHSKKQLAIIMDADGQHPPKVIPEMISIWESTGCNIVDAQKLNSKQGNVLLRFFRNIFFKLFNIVTDFDITNDSDFKLLDKSSIEQIVNIKENDLFFRGLSRWVGFKREVLEFSVEDRVAGRTNWSFWRLFSYAVKKTLSFTAKPLYYVFGIGVIFILISIIVAFNVIYQKLSGVSEIGFPTVIILLMFSSGVIFISLGLIGLYIAKIYNEVKGRPQYIVMERSWSDDD